MFPLFRGLLNDTPTTAYFNVGFCLYRVRQVLWMGLVMPLRGWHDDPRGSRTTPPEDWRTPSRRLGVWTGLGKGGEVIPDDVWDEAWDAPLTAEQWNAVKWIFEDRSEATSA